MGGNSKTTNPNGPRLPGQMNNALQDPIDAELQQDQAELEARKQELYQQRLSIIKSQTAEPFDNTTGQNAPQPGVPQN